MEKELDEELTGKISGGAGVKPKYSNLHGYFDVPKIRVKCAKCEKKFGYVIDEGPVEMIATAYWERQRRRRTCPHCGYVNSEKELGFPSKLKIIWIFKALLFTKNEFIFG